MGLSRARTPETPSSMSTFTTTWILLVGYSLFLLFRLRIWWWFCLTIPFSGAQRVQDIDKLEGEKGAQLAGKIIGSGETSLGEALWCCSNLYSDIKLRLSHKRLMIFTCRDDPHGGDSAKDRQARTKAADLKETGRLNRRWKGHSFSGEWWTLFVCLFIYEDSAH